MHDAFVDSLIGRVPEVKRPEPKRKPVREAKGRRPLNDPPRVGDVWENMATGRHVRIVKLIELKGEAYAKTPHWRQLKH